MERYNRWPKFTKKNLLVSIFFFIFMFLLKIFSLLSKTPIRRSIIPPSLNSKPRNGPISPRDHREREYNHQQHYSSYNSVNHHHSSHNSHHHQNSSSQSHHHHSHHQAAPPPSSQQQPPSYHPNSDLIHFVSSAWKEKVSP